MKAQLTYPDDFRLSMHQEIMFPQKEGYPIVKAKMVNVRSVFSLNRSKVYEFEIIISGIQTTDSTTVLLGDSTVGTLRKVINKLMIERMRREGLDPFNHSDWTWVESHDRPWGLVGKLYPKTGGYNHFINVFPESFYAGGDGADMISFNHKLLKVIDKIQRRYEAKEG